MMSTITTKSIEPSSRPDVVASRQPERGSSVAAAPSPDRTTADCVVSLAAHAAAVSAPANAGTTALLAATAPGGPAPTPPPGIPVRASETSIEESKEAKEAEETSSAAKAARIAISPLGIPAAVVGLAVFCVGFTAVAMTAPILPNALLDRFDAQALWEGSMAPAEWLLEPVIP